MLTEKEIEKWASTQSNVPGIVGCFVAAATWANKQNADEIAAAHKMANTALSDVAFLRQKTQEEITAKDAEIAELVEALREVLRTGLNGGNNIRLSFIAASQKALSEEDLERAEQSEKAVAIAAELLKKYENESVDSD